MAERILVVGNGGREHALLWKLRRDAPGATLFVTRGNGGTAGLAESIPIDGTEIESLAGFALRERIGLTVVGPEVPLANGIVDEFSARGLPIFGPTRHAAELESSKAYAKALMRQHGIPTAAFETFDDPEAAISFVERDGGPLVVKASGLAAGKGAVICETTESAIDAVRAILGEGIFGAAGEYVVVEELMRGEELSVFALTDGESIMMLGAAQDHKRIGEWDTGPNTGGMGAYAPVSIATPELLSQIEREILRPTVAALAEDGRTYRGIVYAGLMITAEGPKVIEFNARFGDPEAQVILPLMESSLLEPMAAIANGAALNDTAAVRWRKGSALTTVIASGGYPGDYEKSVPIQIPPDLESEDVLVFHAGTAIREGRLLTSGGRVMAVTALGMDIGEAAATSREAAERIEFHGSYFRRDIGWREIRR
ncbi:MAG: phosphoribosylamine--glycine ligase [Gemmatimonas sp.]|nr:phosphoribosylamine--glycine ligase [Gemmatimonas sp.]